MDQGEENPLQHKYYHVLWTVCHLGEKTTQCSLVFRCKTEVQIANMMFIGLNKQPEVQLTLSG